MNTIKFNFNIMYACIVINLPASVLPETNGAVFYTIIKRQPMSNVVKAYVQSKDCIIAAYLFRRSRGIDSSGYDGQSHGSADGLLLFRQALQEFKLSRNSSLK